MMEWMDMWVGWAVNLGLVFRQVTPNNLAVADVQGGACLGSPNSEVGVSVWHVVIASILYKKMVQGCEDYTQL